MNHGKPAWYKAARQDADRQLVFTGEMKQEVLRRIEGGGGRRTGWTKRIAVVATLFLFVSAAAWIAGRSDAISGSATGANAPSSLLGQEQIPLQYDADKTTEYHLIKRIPIDSVTIQERRDFPGIGTIYSYKTSEDDDIPHLALSLSNGLDATPSGEFYDFGVGGIDSFKLARSNLFGEDRVKVYADECPNGRCYNYADWIRFDDGQAAIDLHVDYPAIETDLNGDGKTELVMTSRTKYNALFIYQKFDDAVKYAELANALDASSPVSVVLDRDSLVFHAIADDDVRSYRYSDDGLELVRVDTPKPVVHPLKRDNLLYSGYAYLEQPVTMDALVFSGYRSTLMDIGGYELYGQWFQDPARDFGLFLPTSAKAVKGEDGVYAYDLMNGKGTLALETGEIRTPLTYEDDVAVVSNYAGTAVAAEGADSRTDYFLIEADADHRIYVSLTYKLADANKVRPILLAMMAGVKYAPDHQL